MENENEVIVEANEEQHGVQEQKEEEVVEQKPQESLEAKRARLMRQLEQTEKKLGIAPEVREVKTKTSNGLDYAEKAFLVANGIKTSEMKLVEDGLKQTGGNIEGLLENPYFQAQLTQFRELAKTQDATPKGKLGNNIPTDSVEYWMAKPIEEVPKDMRIKVVNARLNKDKSNGVFYNS